MMLQKIQSTRKTFMKIADSVQLESGVVIPCIQGQVGQVDVISQNGYRYKKGFWDKILSDSIISQSIESRDMFGMIEHPLDDEIYIKTPYDAASHVVLKAWVQDGNPYARFGLLNNDRGNQIKALIDVGHHPGVSTRGLGKIEKDNVSQYISDEDYLLITWDIVRSPNFADLKLDKVTDSLMKSPVFAELCEMHNLKDSADEHYQKSKLVQSMDSAINSLLELKQQLLKTF